jgi:chromosome segregation ATPase
MQSKNTRGVQQHEVDAAADALVAERQRPTIERVRQKLGRGSPNTIAPMLEAWFVKLAPRLGVAANDSEEGAMPAEVRNAVDVLWRSALSLAHIQAAEASQSDRIALEQEKLDLATAQSALAVANEQLAQREALLRNALADAQAQADDGRKRAQLLETELARKEVELGQVRDSLGKCVVERDANRRHFDTQLQAAAQEREKHQERAAATERRLLEEVDRARQETRQARSEQVTVAKKHEAVLAELERAKQQLSLAMGDNKAVVAALTEKLAAAEQRVKDFQSALKLSARKTKVVTRKKPET